VGKGRLLEIQRAKKKSLGRIPGRRRGEQCLEDTEFTLKRKKGLNASATGGSPGWQNLTNQSTRSYFQRNLVPGQRVNKNYIVSDLLKGAKCDVRRKKSGCHVKGASSKGCSRPVQLIDRLFKKYLNGCIRGGKEIRQVGARRKIEGKIRNSKLSRTRAGGHSCVK